MHGSDWEDFRHKIRPHVRGIDLDEEAVADVARDLVELVRVSRDEKNEVQDLADILRKWALESMARVALDATLGFLSPKIDPNSDGIKIVNSVKTQLACITKLEAYSGNFPFWRYFPTLTWIKFIKAADVFTVLVFKYIKSSLDSYLSKQSHMKDATILQRMLMDPNMDASSTMVAVADLIMAGIDTTSYTALYLLFLLAKNPEKQEHLYREIISAYPDKNVRIKYQNIEYYNQCFKESLRLLPAVRGNLRIFDRDVVVQGYRAPAGTAVLNIHQVYSRDERFFDNPNDFMPERFEEKTGKRTEILHFGVGKRACIGSMVAKREIFALVCEVLRNYSLEYDYEDFELRTRLVNVPDRPVKLKFVER